MATLRGSLTTWTDVLRPPRVPDRAGGLPLLGLTSPYPYLSSQGFLPK